MKAGDTASLEFLLTTTGGFGVRYADKTTAEAAGWNVYYENGGSSSALTYTLTPVDADDWAASTAYALGDIVIPTSPGNYEYVCSTAGTTGGTEPTWDTTEGGTTSDGTAVWTTRRIEGLHLLAFTAQSGETLVRPTAPYGYEAYPVAYSADVQAADADSIYAAIYSGISTPGVLSGAETDLGTISVEDCYKSAVLTISSTTCSQIFGVTDLSSGYTISAGMKTAAGGTEYSISAAFVDASARTFQFYWDTMPAGLVTAIGDTENTTVYIDVQVKETASGKLFTFGRYQINIKWQRDETT
jgi:hypothetical protein